jgi:hypothetical protein
MNAKHREHEHMEEIEVLAERAERGEDVSTHFANRHVAKQRVNIDFLLALLRQIDAECQRTGATRQAWIQMVCAERLQGLQNAQPTSGEREVTT